MSYRNKVASKNPLGLWMMDDSSPYQDYSNRSASGVTKPGTSASGVSAALVSGAAFSSVFSNTAQGQFDAPVFVQGQEDQAFALEAWLYAIDKTAGTNSEQQVLSHAGHNDGITINGNIVSFTTKYLTSGECRVFYDLQHRRAAHAVGLHNENKNELYVNGELVASLELTDAQKLDSYVATDGKLYSGATSSNQQVAVNALAVYNNLSPDDIRDNYITGSSVFGQAATASSLGGESLDLTGTNEYTSLSWVTKEDFMLGLLVDVEVDDYRVTPTFVDGTSIAGSITFNIPLDIQEVTSIYGVAADWTGEGIVVESSLNGGAWTAVQRGVLFSNISNGFDPTGSDLDIKVSFAGGFEDDSEYLESLSIVGYDTNDITKSATRVMTATHPSVVRENHEPIEFDERNGIALNGGTLTISGDTGVDAPVVRTVEIWCKPKSGSLTHNLTGVTQYVNGAASASAPSVGEWSLIHHVLAADKSGDITFSGNVIIGQATLYPYAMSAADVLESYRAYLGFPVVRVSDSSSITVFEPADSVTTYDYEWEITGGGG